MIATSSAPHPRDLIPPAPAHQAVLRFPRTHVVPLDFYLSRMRLHATAGIAAPFRSRVADSVSVPMSVMEKAALATTLPPFSFEQLTIPE